MKESSEGRIENIANPKMIDTQTKNRPHKVVFLFGGPSGTIGKANAPSSHARRKHLRMFLVFEPLLLKQKMGSGHKKTFQFKNPPFGGHLNWRATVLLVATKVNLIA